MQRWYNSKSELRDHMQATHRKLSQNKELFSMAVHNQIALQIT